MICLSSGDTPASLEVGKVYERLRDNTAEATAMLRIVDESGEDYLHPARLFGRISQRFDGSGQTRHIGFGNDDSACADDIGNRARI